MSTFYGSLRGGRSSVTRTGTRNSGIKSSVQSWRGSVITYLDYDEDNNLIVRIETSEGSDRIGTTKFRGTLEELNKVLESYKGE